MTDRGWLWIGGLAALVVLAFVVLGREEGYLEWGLVIIGGMYSVLLLRRDQSNRRYERLLLVAVLVSLVSDLYLLENYLFALSGEADGITVANEFSYLVFGEDHWSVERFRDAYDTSMRITLILVVVYALLLVRNRGNNSG